MFFGVCNIRFNALRRNFVSDVVYLFLISHTLSRIILMCVVSHTAISIICDAHFKFSLYHETLVKGNTLLLVISKPLKHIVEHQTQKLPTSQTPVPFSSAQQQN